MEEKEKVVESFQTSDIAYRLRLQLDHEYKSRRNYELHFVVWIDTVCARHR
jgi:hypothetical protein